jgi:hypothetical protein
MVAALKNVLFGTDHPPLFGRPSGTDGESSRNFEIPELDAIMRLTEFLLHV